MCFIDSCLFDQMKRCSHEASKPRDLRSTSVSTSPAHWRGCQSWLPMRNWALLSSATSQLSRELLRHSEEWYIWTPPIVHSCCSLIKRTYWCSNVAVTVVCRMSGELWRSPQGNVSGRGQGAGLGVQRDGTPQPSAGSYVILLQTIRDRLVCLSRLVWQEEILLETELDLFGCHRSGRWVAMHSSVTCISPGSWLCPAPSRVTARLSSERSRKHLIM